MPHIRHGVRVAILSFILLAATIALNATVTELELRLTKESAPPGGITQVKLEVTEPKPITTGGFFMFSGFSSIAGIALGSQTNDAAGIAVVNGGNLALSIVSPSGTFGWDDDYPVLMVSGQIPATARLGSVTPVRLDARALRFVGPGGAIYSTEIKAGSLTAANTLSISDVVPGSAVVPAGGVVTVHGTGFESGMRLRFKDREIAQVRYVSPQRMDVVLARSTRMHGVEIEARSRNGDQRVFYFSYQRGKPSGTSTHAVLRAVYPVFPLATSLAWSVPLSSLTAGVALQNPGAIDTTVIATLNNQSGMPIAAAVVNVPADRYVVRSLPEVFGFSVANASSVRFSSASPVQVLGVNVDAAGAASPVLPQ